MGRYNIATKRFEPKPEPPEPVSPATIDSGKPFGLTNLTEVSFKRTQFFRPSHERRRIALAFDDSNAIFVAVKTHFIAGRGYFRCDGGSCCRANKARYRVGCPIVVYENNGASFEVQPFVFGEGGHRVLVDKLANPKNDFVIFQPSRWLFEIEPINNCIWRSRVQTQGSILKEAARIRSQLPGWMAKTYVPEVPTEIKGSVETLNNNLDDAIGQVPYRTVNPENIDLSDILENL